MSRRLKALLVFTVIVAIAAVVAISGILPRLRDRQATGRANTHYRREPVVTIVHPNSQNASQEVVLPG